MHYDSILSNKTITLLNKFKIILEIIKRKKFILNLNIVFN